MCSYDSSGDALHWFALDGGDAPVLLSSLESPGFGVVEISVGGDLAVVSRYSGVWSIVDFGDPGAPAVVFTDTVTGMVYQNDVVDGLLYLATTSDGLLVYDITDPTAPTGSRPHRGRRRGGVVLDPRRSLLGDRNRGYESFVRVYDIADLTLPILRDEKTVGYYPEAVAST